MRSTGASSASGWGSSCGSGQRRVKGHNLCRWPFRHQDNYEGRIMLHSAALRAA